MSQKLLEISNRFLTACAFHREQADLMWFLSLPGYSMLHETQAVDEGFTQRRLKAYITRTAGVLHDDTLPETANILTEATKGKNRKDLTEKDVQEILRKSWQSYFEWESDTFAIYQRITAELLQQGEVSAFGFLQPIISNVRQELDFINDTIVQLQAHGWDMPQIVADQLTIAERYEYKIKKLLGESKKFHHWNSAVNEPLIG